MSSITRAVAVTVVLLVLAAPAGPQVPDDHLKCYRMNDALHLKGTADLDTRQFGVDPGCKISPAKIFCVPATTTHVAVTNKKTKEPITPLPIAGVVTGARTDKRICYKVKCPKPATPIADQVATDQFGSRTLAKLRATLVCTSAFSGATRFVHIRDTIIDNYTGLEWMKMNNLDGVMDFGNPQDADNRYTWSSSGTAADGTAFTDLLSRLNVHWSTDGRTGFLGFAGHHDWRLPTVAELGTLLFVSPPCLTSPCIFGPNAVLAYWSSTTTGAGSPGVAWVANFAQVRIRPEMKTANWHVRAVRGGS